MDVKELPEDLDEATCLYIKELQEICQNNPRRFGRKLEMTRQQYVSFWKGVNKHTQSSTSGIHYGTSKASVRDAIASEALAKHMMLMALSGVHPPRGEVAMLLLLVKAKDSASVDNSRYLIIFEADFNHAKGHFW